MSVIFDGYEIMPLGQASLNLVNGKLEVSNMSSSCLDGFAVRTNDDIHIKVERSKWGSNS
jgi:hypothetical protein